MSKTAFDLLNTADDLVDAFNRLFEDDFQYNRQIINLPPTAYHAPGVVWADQVIVCDNFTDPSHEVRQNPATGEFDPVPLADTTPLNKLRMQVFRVVGGYELDPGLGHLEEFMADPAVETTPLERIQYFCARNPAFNWNYCIQEGGSPGDTYSPLWNATSHGPTEATPLLLAQQNLNPNTRHARGAHPAINLMGREDFEPCVYVLRDPRTRLDWHEVAKFFYYLDDAHGTVSTIKALGSLLTSRAFAELISNHPMPQFLRNFVDVELDDSDDDEDDEDDQEENNNNNGGDKRDNAFRAIMRAVRRHGQGLVSTAVKLFLFPADYQDFVLGMALDIRVLVVLYADGYLAPSTDRILALQAPNPADFHGLDLQGLQEADPDVPDLLDQALKCVRFFNIMARLPVEVQSLTVRTLFPSLAERQVASRDNFEAALRRFSLMGL